MNDTEMMILELCREATSKTPVRRKELVDKLHIRDRYVRIYIGTLRDKGFRIINNHYGYWLATPEEYKAWLPEYLSYANTIYRRKKAMDNFVDS